jgi:hypothetical protein
MRGKCLRNSPREHASPTTGLLIGLDRVRRTNGRRRRGTRTMHREIIEHFHSSNGESDTGSWVSFRRAPAILPT